VEIVIKENVDPGLAEASSIGDLRRIRDRDAETVVEIVWKTLLE